MSFSKKIKSLRQEKGWSQGQLAEELNIHREQISTYERGQVIPNTEILMQLAKVFQVSIDYLVFDEEEKSFLVADIKDKELLKQFKSLDKMNEKDRKLVKDLIEVVVVKNKVQELVTNQ